MHQLAKRLASLLLVPVLMLGLSMQAFAASGDNPSAAEPDVGHYQAERFQVNFKPGVTDIGQEIYDIHMFVFWVCVATAAFVLFLMVFAVIRYRRSVHPTASQFHENTVLELAWTIIPFIILIAMAVPASTLLIKMYDTSEADMDILITGYQWKWKYEYQNPNGENVSFFSNLLTPESEINNEDEKGSNYLLEVDEPLVLPVGKKVRFLVTANDVLHAWWVPALAVKRDAVPGFVNEAWTRANETGVFRGQCAELCGRSHGYMPIVVKVVEQDEYETWIAEKQIQASLVSEAAKTMFTMDQLVQTGKEVYGRACVACHGVNGEGGVGPAIAGSSIATGSVYGHIEILINGRPGSAMQAFGAQLSAVDIASVITYQRNSFGNNMGDKVQPVDIVKFGKGQ